MSERFFLATPPQGGRAVLVGDEARHCGGVLRARVGDEIRVFDGSGAEWPARIEAVARDTVTVELGSPLPARPEPAVRLTIAVALPKGERQKWLVEKLTELGVARLVPLMTQRGVAEATDAARGRLVRGVIEACKQCGRNTLMEIGEPATLGQIGTQSSQATRLIAHPGGRPLAAALGPEAADVVAAIGPEGGFTAEEIDTAESVGFTAASLGPTILRVETAAIALAAAAILFDGTPRR